MNTNMTYEYPVLLTLDEVDGGYTVQFPDLPEAITQGDSIEHALQETRDALDEAIANRIVTKQVIPSASAGACMVPVPAGTALKAAFYSAVTERKLSQVVLAAELGVDEREVRRLVDPYHPTKLNRIEELLGMLGKRLVVQVQST